MSLLVQGKECDSTFLINGYSRIGYRWKEKDYKEEATWVQIKKGSGIHLPKDPKYLFLDLSAGLSVLLTLNNYKPVGKGQTALLPEGWYVHEHHLETLGVGVGGPEHNPVSLPSLLFSTSFSDVSTALIPHLGARKLLYVGTGQGRLGMKAWKTLDNQGPESTTQTSTPVSGY